MAKSIFARTVEKPVKSSKNLQKLRYTEVYRNI